jgi:hypothetical protein
VNRSSQPEAVLTPPQSQALITYAKALEDGYSGRGQGVQINMTVNQQPGQNAADLAREIDRRLSMSGVGY